MNFMNNMALEDSDFTFFTDQSHIEHKTSIDFLTKQVVKRHRGFCLMRPVVQWGHQKEEKDDQTKTL